MKRFLYILPVVAGLMLLAGFSPADTFGKGRYTVEAMKQALEAKRDSFPELIRGIEAEARTTADTAEAAVLRSMAAEMYLRYYQANRWKINARTPLLGYRPADLREWPADLFTDTIRELLDSSLQPAAFLQSQPSGRFAALLEKDKNPRRCPSLYDLLAARACTLVPSEAYYRDWLEFRRSRADSTLLCLTELDYLKYRYNMECSHSDYTAATQHYAYSLDSLYALYENFPVAVEIMDKQVEASLEQASRSRQSDSLYARAYRLCKEGIARYPHYDRIQILKNRLYGLESRNLMLQGPQTVYPGSRLHLKLSYKNVGEVRLRLFRKGEGKALADKSFRLPKAPPYLSRDTTLSLPVGKALGEYVYRLISSDDSLSVCDSFRLSRLAVAANWGTEEGQRQILVTDFRSGAPLRGAELLYYETAEGKQQLVRKPTDANGLAILEDPRASYRVAYKGDTSAVSTGRTYFYRPPQPSTEEKKENLHIALFTDRGIYRPGQTVYFKGIAYVDSNGRTSLAAGRRILVGMASSDKPDLKDAFASKEFQTNEYGSFHGEMRLPKDRRMGRYLLVTSAGSTSFRIEAYKRPTFQLQMQALEGEARFGEALELRGKAQTYSGMPLTEGQVDYRILRVPVFFNFGREEQVTRGAASLAPDGSFRIRFRPEKPANAGASCFESYRLLASLTDSKGETQETQLFFSAGERSLFLQCHVNGTFNKEADSLCIQARTSKGATASVKGHYAIYRLPSEAPEAAPQGRPFLEGDFSAGKPLPRKLTAALPSAPLLLRMEANDDQGRPVSDSCRFTAFSYADKRPPIQTPIWLPAPEQPDCLPGEEAVFLFGTSEKKAYVLCQFFGNGKAVATQRIVLKRENRLLRLPFKEDYADLSARFTFIKEGKVYSRQTQVGKRQPKKEIRFVPLSFRDMLQPGEKESWQFRLSDAAARPVKAEVLASMYDASLDALQPFRWNFSPFEKPLPRYIPPFREEAGMGEDYSQDVWQEALVQTAPIGFADIDWQGLFGLIRSPLYYGTMQTPFPESVYMRKNAILADEAVSPNTDSAPAKMPETLPQWRQNFNETAFFFPELHTDTAGTLRIDFTLPDSNTRWKLQVLAHTRDLNYGLYTAEAVSQKPLMLIPNLPRFLRRGDTASVSVQIANQTEATLSGRLRFELFDPDNGEIFFADSTQSFRVAARGMAKASWNFPVRMGGTEVGCRLLASTPQGSDGEQDLLPLLPDRLPMTDALPFYLGNDSASLLLRPKPHPGSRYTLEYTANALWAAAETLPFLFKADTHNQDLLSVFASYYSAAIASFLYETIPEIRGIKGFAYLSDKNRMAERRTFFLERLQKTQNPDGGWGWCEGMRSDRGVTLYLLEGMARLRRLALDDSGREYTQKAVGFLDAAFRKDAAELSDKKNYVPSARQIRMLYVRSLYRDLPETADTRRATRYFSTQAGRYWQKTSLAGKVQTALLMQADGDKETAAAILAWLRRTATISPEQGMYWANNRREGSGLLSPIGLHCLIMEAFRSLGGTEKETDRMRQWLLVQKRVQAWESVPATADALYALLRSGSSWTGLLKAPSLQWNGRPLKAVEGEAGSGHFRQKLPPTTGGHPSLLLHKTGTAPAWGALLTTYTLPMQEATAQKGALHLERQYFIETNDGRQRLLRPLEEGQALHVGEKVVIRLVIRSDREMDYVRLEDLRPAGLEPLKQISGMERSGSLLYYHSPQDEAELFYFDRLPQGTYVLEYATYVSRPGSYAVGPATLQCLYAPEFLSRTVGKELKVIP